ncbi:MAG: hypothetical protein AAF688_12440 [Bacteroidota bacterium]
MRRYLFLLIPTVFLCCDYFEKQKVFSEDLLEEELKTFNWNEVDEYPSFESCNNAQNRKDCFENTLRDKLNTNLAEHLIVVSEELKDTIGIELLISKEGELNVQIIEISEETKRIIPEIDSLIRHSLDSLPKIFPAIKRSQPVETQFILPILIKVE